MCLNYPIPKKVCPTHNIKLDPVVIYMKFISIIWMVAVIGWLVSWLKLWHVEPCKCWRVNKVRVFASNCTFSNNFFKIIICKLVWLHSLWLLLIYWRCPWCNGYCRRKWTRRHEFKAWTRLIAFRIALIPLGKVWIQLFSHQLWLIVG